MSYSPSLWSGACFPFTVSSVKAVTGKIVILDENKIKPLENQEVTMTVDGRTVAFPAGTNGEFYLENALAVENPAGDADPLSCSGLRKKMSRGSVIEPGRYNASAEYKGEKCEFSIAFPETEDVITDLGEIRCVVMRREVSEPVMPLPDSPPHAAPVVPASAPSSEDELAGDTFVIDPTFDKNGAPLLKRDRKALARVARMLKNNARLFVEIEVPGDRGGTEEQSMRLRRKRAETIRRYLTASGVKADKIRNAGSLGKKLVCEEPTAFCDKINRRVIIRVGTEGADSESRNLQSPAPAGGAPQAL
jgi:outer membrane protein OmpA-like peptidoglycan-associated protein